MIEPAVTPKRMRKKTPRRKRAYSVEDLLKDDIQVFPFEGEWKTCFGQPPRGALFCVWGDSGNGKSTFVMELAKYLCGFGKVLYNSLEEGVGLSFRNTVKRMRMVDVKSRFQVVEEDIPTLTRRMEKEKSPEIVIIDSLQVTELRKNSYLDFLHRMRSKGKTVVIVSRAEGSMPEGRLGKRVMYDADVKIYVEGMLAVCKGRFLPKDEAPFPIWEEGSARYRLNHQ